MSSVKGDDHGETIASGAGGVLRHHRRVSAAVTAGDGKTDGLRFVTANGSPAVAIPDGGEHDMISTASVNEDGLISWIYIMRNPDKLPH